MCINLGVLLLESTKHEGCWTLTLTLEVIDCNLDLPASHKNIRFPFTHEIIITCWFFVTKTEGVYIGKWGRSFLIMDNTAYNNITLNQLTIQILGYIRKYYATLINSDRTNKIPLCKYYSTLKIYKKFKIWKLHFI